MLEKRKHGKRTGFILSLDALIAIGLLLTLSFFLLNLSSVFPSAELKYHRFYYVGKDMLNVMEQMKMSALVEYPNLFKSLFICINMLLNNGKI